MQPAGTLRQTPPKEEQGEETEERGHQQPEFKGGQCLLQHPMPGLLPQPWDLRPIHHDGSSSNLATIPDAGVVMTIIGAQHLSSLGLSKEDLTLPINTIYYKADGSNMPPATGSFWGTITYGNLSITRPHRYHELSARIWGLFWTIFPGSSRIYILPLEFKGCEVKQIRIEPPSVATSASGKN